MSIESNMKSIAESLKRIADSLEKDTHSAVTTTGAAQEYQGEASGTADMNQQAEQQTSAQAQENKPLPGDQQQTAQDQPAVTTELLAQVNAEFGQAAIAMGDNGQAIFNLMGQQGLKQLSDVGNDYNLLISLREQVQAMVNQGAAA